MHFANKIHVDDVVVPLHVCITNIAVKIMQLGNS